MTSDIVSSDNWKLNCILGTGGFGIVELWAHVQTGKKLAIKKCKLNYSQLTPIQQKRWVNEVDIMKRLNHPNIVRTECVPFKLSNVGENLPVLCMEYCKKGDLRKVILNQPKNCCGIIEIEAIKIMTEILSAVEYLHSHNITHRDLKPENIVLQDEKNLSYKLIDLGYAKELGETSTSASLVGTLNYVAPELLWKETYSCSVDYWSLGILFYELVTGIRPFLPTMQHTMEWMKYIQNKSYDDIYACEKEGKVIFGKDIQDPTHLSKDLQLLIEKDTNIEVKHQVLTDYNGVMLTENTASVISQTNDHIFFLFRNGCCLIEDIPKLNIPIAVEKMIIRSKDEINYETLKDYYRHAIYFATKEVNLFQLYIFALSINIDLLHQKIDAFNTNMEMTLENTKALIDQVHTIRIKYMNLGEDAIDRKKMQTYFDKVDKLVSAADQIKMQFMSLKSDNDKLRNKAQSIDCVRDLSELYDKMCDVYLEFKKESPHKTAKPQDMVKLVFAFYSTREVQLHNKNIADIISQIDKLNDGLLKLEKIFNSVTIMTKLYWKEYQLIAQSDMSPQQSNNQSLNISTTELDKVIQSEDNMIYDNLVIRYKLDNLMAEMQKKYHEMVNLDL
ncbi:inhibitor of nuclear factor kappa-b kinase subunit beta [Lasius niger]|uniref:IkappaB kinase n=1 Tax=Lasius niger TaxID=67767 RepID=A0A0J7L911_LASNI|nr:inhibitor of nuclear factor kappa-b kinase subunit beta [Lasius niger]